MLLLVSFLIGGRTGKFICQGVSKFMKHKPTYFDEISGARCYPYFYIWKNMITSTFDKKKLFLSNYIPSAPVVYLYGKNKPFQFAGNKWNNYILEHEHCELHGLDTGHWIMRSHNAFLTDLILRRLKSLKK